MSDSEKLRKTYGNLWLALSLFILALCVSSFWLIALLKDVLIGFLLLIGISILSLFFVLAASNGYNYFVDVSEKKIARSDKAKLLKIQGLISLTTSFAFFAFCICCLWVIFLFWGDTGFIFLLLFMACSIMFSILSKSSCSKFMAIKKLFDE